MRQGSTRAWRAVRALVLERDGYACRMERAGQVCGKPASTVDHIVPRAEGGTDDIRNLRAACRECNYRAGGYLSRERAGYARRQAPANPSQEVLRLAHELDRLDLAPDTGRRVAQRALRREGVPCGASRDVDDACAYRRSRPMPSREW